MFSPTGLFPSPNHAVLSLNVQADAAVRERVRSQFEVLVRHLLYRFFHNELIASDHETKRVMLIGYTAGLPTLLVSLFLYPAYHAFPPAQYPRPFWPQVGDHYFYVMYSFLIMGAAALYEWDLLFPDILDIFILSVLPISARRLFFARVLALTIFLALVLLGTSVLGFLVFPIGAGLPSLGRHLLAHAVAVLMSGAFTAGAFLALQGVLINTVGDRVFRRITPILQGSSIILLLAVLLLYPTLSHFLKPLLTSGIRAARWFPPFWFLGVYERLLQGPATLPTFSQLARTACEALALTFGFVVLTYPLAYRRRVRQLVEGAQTKDTPGRATVSIDRLLHATILRIPAQRAVFHFIRQTVLRTPRQRMMLALYSGIAIALCLSNMLILEVNAGHLSPSITSYGIRTAVPIMAFCAVIGLGSILSTPIDRRAAWIFSALTGRPGPDHIAGMRIWITLWALLISLTTVTILHLLSPHSMRTNHIFLGQLLVAIGASLILTDIRLFPVRTFPFTYLRTSAITDFPLMIVRYFVLFPFLVVIVVQRERWIEANLSHVLITAAVVAATHLLLQRAYHHILQQSTLNTPPEEGEEFPQRLGLREH